MVTYLGLSWDCEIQGSVSSLGVYNHSDPAADVAPTWRWQWQCCCCRESLERGWLTGGVQKALVANGLKAMHHLLMELDLKRRRVVAIGSMRTLHWSTDRAAGLRGGLCMSMKAPWPVAVQACQVTRESWALHGEARTWDHLKGERSTKSIPSNFWNAQLVSSNPFNYCVQNQ